MADRNSFLIRTDPRVLEALRLWARDELRSANGQIEYLLRKALRDAGRLGPGSSTSSDPPGKPPEGRRRRKP